jgi:hypothetical protein
MLPRIQVFHAFPYDAADFVIQKSNQRTATQILRRRKKYQPSDNLQSTLPLFFSSHICNEQDFEDKLSPSSSCSYLCDLQGAVYASDACGVC